MNKTSFPCICIHCPINKKKEEKKVSSLNSSFFLWLFFPEETEVFQDNDTKVRWFQEGQTGVQRAPDVIFSSTAQGETHIKQQHCLKNKTKKKIKILSLLRN